MDKTDVSSVMPVADFRNPWMGLNGHRCKHPAYWCRSHKVWLSEEDVKSKHCFQKLTYNMLDTHKCLCIERREINPWTKETVHN